MAFQQNFGFGQNTAQPVGAGASLMKDIWRQTNDPWAVPSEFTNITQQSSFAKQNMSVLQALQQDPGLTTFGGVVGFVQSVDPAYFSDTATNYTVFAPCPSVLATTAVQNLINAGLSGFDPTGELSDPREALVGLIKKHIVVGDVSVPSGVNVLAQYECGNGMVYCVDGLVQ